MRSFIQVSRSWLLVGLVPLAAAGYLLNAGGGHERLAEVGRAYAGEPGPGALAHPEWTGGITEAWAGPEASRAQVPGEGVPLLGSRAEATTHGPDQPEAASNSVAALDNKVFVPHLLRGYRPPVVDDFSSASSGWPVGENDNAMAGYLEGGYRILVKPSNLIIGLSPSLTAGDFRAEVDGRPAAHLEGGYGVYFAEAGQGYYFYSIYRGTGVLLQRFDRPVASWTALMFRASHPAVNAGGLNRLGVERRGSTITLYVNGQQVGQVVDGTYGVGTFGLAAASLQVNFDARFDNFALIFTPAAP